MLDHAIWMCTSKDKPISSSGQFWYTVPCVPHSPLTTYHFTSSFDRSGNGVVVGVASPDKELERLPDHTPYAFKVNSVTDVRSFKYFC